MAPRVVYLALIAAVPGWAPRASGRPQKARSVVRQWDRVPGAYVGLWCIGHVKHLEVWVTRLSCCGLPMCATSCAGMQSAVEAAGGSSYEQPSERFLERPEVDLMRPRRARLA